jgi:methylglyoxal synthase
LLGAIDSWAMLLPTTDPSSRQAELGQIQAQLETKVVQDRLNALGLTSEEVQARVQQLSDDQIHELSQNLDGLQMGGDALVVILIIIGAVVLVLFLISSITGTAHDVGHAAGGH